MIEINYIPSDGDADSLMEFFHSIVSGTIQRHVNNEFYPDFIKAYIEKMGFSNSGCMTIPLWKMADDAEMQYDDVLDAPFVPVNGQPVPEMTVGEWIEHFIQKQVVEVIDNEHFHDWVHLLSEKDPASFRGLTFKLNARLSGCMLGNDVWNTLKSYGYLAIYEYLRRKAFPEEV